MELHVCRCRFEELPSPIDGPTNVGRVRSLESADPHRDVDVGQPVSRVSSRSSHSSLMRKAAMDEVRRAFFTSSSTSSLADGARSKEDLAKSSEKTVQLSQSSREFAVPSRS